MSDYRVVVTGSQKWVRVRDVHRGLDEARGRVPAGCRMVVVHGHAKRGADAIADAWVTRRRIARDDGVTVERHPADWERYGNAAGMIRNPELFKAPADECLSFIRDGSPGSTNATGYAIAAGVRVTLHLHNGDDDTAVTVVDPAAGGGEADEEDLAAAALVPVSAADEEADSLW